MPRFTIKVSHRPDIKVPTFTTAQMQEIGDYALTNVMKPRVASGIDVLDEPAKPLTEKYRKRKLAKGKSQIRDILLTGNTLGSTQVTEVDEAHVKIKVRGSTPFRKALFNQNIDPWFGLSGHDDERLMAEKVRPIFHQNLSDLSRG